jgi:imidazoleglycerol-phosphate dehydratase / histidinol-phosphatase
MMLTSPFKALDAQNSGLETLPPDLRPLTQRMAQVYGVDETQLMVTRGASHAFEVLLRRLRVYGYEMIWAKAGDHIDALCSVYNLQRKSPTQAYPRGGGLYLIDNPSFDDGRALELVEARTIAVEIFPALLVIDESYSDICADKSLVSVATSEPNVVVLKSLSWLYGLSGARVGALLASAKTLAGLQKFCEPHPLPTPSVHAAMSALSPSRSLSVLARIEMIGSEQARMREALADCDLIDGFELNDAPFVILRPKNKVDVEKALKAVGLVAFDEANGLRLGLGDMAYNNRLLAALGVAVNAARPRQAQVLRDTKETRISVLVDLDAPRPVKAETGIGFFDHMLEQVATHAGFSLQLKVEGDLYIDGHHTVEDTMLAFGAALKQALGDRIGMARFGFVLPMDETEAKVSIDISGRAFCVFKGDFTASHIGDYQTEMTPHAFRSLSETLGASIHVEVEGGNDHHKTEACFKALGRALRQAVRIEGDALPSTKGMLA